MKLLRETIRKLILENRSDLQNLAELLMSDEYETIIHAIGIGETLDHLVVLQQQEGGRSTFSPYGYVAWKLQVDSALLDEMLAYQTKNYDPSRYVTLDKEKGTAQVIGKKPKTYEEQERLDIMNRKRPSELDDK